MTIEECQEKIHIYIDDFGALSKVIVNGFTIPWMEKLIVESPLDDYGSLTVKIPLKFVTMHHQRDNVEEITKG